MTNKPHNVSDRPLYVVHLDDHHLYRKGVKLCLVEGIPKVFIEGFDHTQNALSHITERFQKGEEIDLIITDYTPLGPDALVFAKAVRALEKQFATKTKIMLLTLCWGEEELIKATDEGVFDAYFPKTIEPQQLIYFATKGMTSSQRIRSWFPGIRPMLQRLLSLLGKGSK